MAPRGRPFRMGHTKTAGRAKGVPNRVTVEARELAQRLVADPDYLESLERRLKQGELAPAMEAALWAYAFGKPKEASTGPPALPARFTLNIENVSPQRHLLTSTSTPLGPDDEHS